MGDLFASGGVSNYPTSLDTATTQVDASPTLPFGNTTAHASKANNLASGLINVETELGTTPSGSYSDVTARFDDIPNLNTRVAVNKNSGATVGTRRRINFIEGSNITLTIADDSGNEEVDVTIAGAAGSTQEFFGTGSDGAVTDQGGGTVTRNGILNATTYQIGGSGATTLTHDVNRALHIKASTSFTAAANGTVSLNSKGGAGGTSVAAPATGNTGGAGIIPGGGGGGGDAAVATIKSGDGGNGGGLSGGAGGQGEIQDSTNAVISQQTAGLAGGAVLFLSDMGFTSQVAGPGAGGGGGGATGTGSGGASGGAGGGILTVESPSVTLTAGYSFTATGAAGGAGGAAGGGGGGGGGMFILRRRTLTGSFAATLTAGAAGTGTAAGGAGATGRTVDEVLP